MAIEKVYFEGKELVEHLERMLELAKAGAVNCVAYRIFKDDGTWEDVAAGGTEEQRAAMLAKLREQH
ncbi:hypothetical protein [Variovorax sp. PBL-E5]|uniref:hypothetical protein n=1 Tax=Variovorax sp. PBL-E5 TaxID=434014 RepID=UPI0013163653|nr:hypothetical protein [Variovorax sp. PBL-E5]VTU37125.1 hypothetical protein E5CHR_04492 [Variovorax sp. PBL-E5]